jgi:uncharacterized protein
VARLINLLFYYTGKTDDRAAAQNALGWVESPEIAGKRFSDVGGVLLADEELHTEPAHVTIVGHKNDPAAQALWRAALKFPSAYRRIEWFDPDEGPLPNPDVPYPSLSYAAAFLCTGGACSTPMKDAAALEQRIAKIASNN